MQRYSQEEAEEILRRAAQAPLGEYTSDELRRSAAELGISPEALARAEAEMREERTRKEFDRYLKGKMRSEIVGTLTTIAIVAGINLATSPEYLWFLWVAPWMLLSLFGTLQKTWSRESEGYHRAFARWQAKRERNEALSPEL